jgi:iron(III) transport system substrate-binding protein
VKRPSILAFLFSISFLAWAESLKAAPLDELVAAAKKENTIEFYGPSPLAGPGSQALAAAFNQKYGLNIRVQFHPSQDMAKNVGTVVSRAATGVPPEWDVMVLTDAHHATLWLKKLLKPFAYQQLGVEPRAIQYDNGTISFVHQVALPAYNANFLPANDVPKTWEDLLEPKWKGRKIAASSATHHLARLAVGVWGEEKMAGYIQRLVKQDLYLGRMAEIYTRLLLGEVLLSLTLVDDFIFRAKEKGALLAHAEEIEPVITPAYHIGVLRGAEHPNAGHLFAFFLTSLEAQRVWERHTGQSSAFVPGTTRHEKLKGKQAIFMTQDQAERIDTLARQYSKMLGFR